MGECGSLGICGLCAQSMDSGEEVLRKVKILASLANDLMYVHSCEWVSSFYLSVSAHATFEASMHVFNTPQFRLCAQSH